MRDKYHLKLRITRKILKIPRLGTVLSYRFTEEGLRLQQTLIHKNIKGYPKTKGFVTKDIQPTKQDLLLTKRLLTAYHKETVAKNNLTHKDIWTILAKGPHAEFINLLQKGDVNEVAFYLCNMSRMGITYGLTQGKDEYNKLISDSTYRRWLDLLNLDKLITLAEALGVLPVEDPEQGKFGLSIFLNVNEAVKKIEQYLKIKIVPPSVEGGLYKLSTFEGGLHNRDITSLYTAVRCRDILKIIINPSICEIGAGIGKNAYYSYLLGINRYTIIDLPYINVLQGFYLIKTLPMANIYLYGEDQTKVKNKNGSIFILPDWSLKEMSGKQFDLTLNQDSFPEIDKIILLEYLQQIRLHTRKFFLSINQESNNIMIVKNLKQHVLSSIMSKEKGVELIYRFPYWLRLGYIEELYEIK